MELLYLRSNPLDFPMNVLFLQDAKIDSWPALFKYFGSNPMQIMIWVVVLLVILFVMSRLNNFMEVKGVNRAISVTRALVGSFMYFVIIPIVIFALINVMAFLYGAPMIDVSFLWRWIALTGTSYFWFLKCMFNSTDVVGDGTAPSYTVHSIIRILWILLPIMLIWFRTFPKRNGRLLLIPFIILILVVTRHKFAPETFLTSPEVMETLKHAPIIGNFFDLSKQKKNVGGASDETFTPMQRKVIAGILIVVILAGLGMGLFGNQRVIGLVVTMMGIFGFILISPSRNADDILIVPKNKEHPFHHNIDSLVHRLDSVYRAEGPESITVYELTVGISNAYKAQQHREEFPDSLCQRYKPFFYDWCK